jgi:hypothetical protein
MKDSKRWRSMVMDTEMAKKKEYLMSLVIKHRRKKSMR